MTLKKSVKQSIRLFIEADGNLYTLAIRTSKAQLLKILDCVIPDDEK